MSVSAIHSIMFISLAVVYCPVSSPTVASSDKYMNIYEAALALVRPLVYVGQYCQHCLAHVFQPYLEVPGSSIIALPAHHPCDGLPPL